MNPKVSIELTVSQWWAIVYSLRGEDLGGNQPSLANHLVRSISRLCPSSLEETYDETNALMELEAL